MNEDILSRSKELCNFLDKGVTPYHVVLNAEEMLEKASYKRLNYNENWDISNNFKGFVKVGDSSLFAFDINKDELIKEGFKFISSHIDSPCLKIKTGSDIVFSDNNVFLNVEIYGGPILNTWLDRGLSIAGCIYFKDEDYKENFKVNKKFIDFEETVAFIPNCPIHLNRDVNNGFGLNKQKHMLPLVFSQDMCKFKNLRELIGSKFSLDSEDIIDFDLYLYDSEKSKLVGANKEFIQSKKLDDLCMAEASLYSLINTNSSKNKFICLFDGEEIGSGIKEGAFSHTLLNIITRIYENLSFSKCEMDISLSNSFMISADMAHAYNPMYAEKFDDNNRCIINKGVVVKSNSNRSYMTTGKTAAYFKSICDRSEVPYQNYYNRSDILGGSTLGPLTTRYLSIEGVDIGNAMFAMHSCRETSGILDHYYITKVFETYFK